MRKRYFLGGCVTLFFLLFATQIKAESGPWMPTGADRPAPRLFDNGEGSHALAGIYCRVVPASPTASVYRDLNWSETFPGAQAETISSHGLRSAELGLQGMTDEVSILLPKQVELEWTGGKLLKRSSVPQKKTITITRMNLSVNRASTSKAGSLKVDVGATRPPLPPTQKVGAYQGRLVINLVRP